MLSIVWDAFDCLRKENVRQNYFKNDCFYDFIVCEHGYMNINPHLNYRPGYALFFNFVWLVFANVRGISKNLCLVNMTLNTFAF